MQELWVNIEFQVEPGARFMNDFSMKTQIRDIGFSVNQLQGIIFYNIFHMPWQLLCRCMCTIS